MSYTNLNLSPASPYRSEEERHDRRTSTTKCHQSKTGMRKGNPKSRKIRGEDGVAKRVTPKKWPKYDIDDYVYYYDKG
jgi:hypothetical protein